MTYYVKIPSIRGTLVVQAEAGLPIDPLAPVREKAVADLVALGLDEIDAEYAVEQAEITEANPERTGMAYDEDDLDRSGQYLGESELTDADITYGAPEDHDM